MLDNYKREITYLRISVTEFCNFRCRYCMPKDGVCIKKHTDMLTYEEIILCCKVAQSLGIKKIRLTGGEPLIKKDIVSLVSKIREIDGIEEICMTTNASLLKDYAKDLKNAGLNRINISLDTLNEKKFKYITRIGNFKDTLIGIDTALQMNFDKVKINTVLIGGFNDDEIVDISKLTLDKNLDVRFIELMPMYDSGDFNENSYISYNVALNMIKEKFSLSQIQSKKGSVAKLYKIDNAKGCIGFISPVSEHFCFECNRIRLTADGKLKPCLHSSDEILVKGLSYNELVEKFKEAILLKPKKHNLLSHTNRSNANRNMNEIGG